MSGVSPSALLLALLICLVVFRALDAPWWLAITGVIAYGFLVLLVVSV
jgi:hypothetical protein